MDPTSFGLTLFATADLCLKYGKQLAALCQDYRHANSEIRETLLLLRTLWHRIEHQLILVRDISESLGDDLQILHNQLLGMLQNRLHDLIGKVHNLSNQSSFMRKIKYASYSKDSLQTSIKELEDWYRRWDPSWFMITRLVSPIVDTAIQRQKQTSPTQRPLRIVEGLRKSSRLKDEQTSESLFEFLPEDVKVNKRQSIPFSAASISVRSDSGSIVVVDTVPCTVMNSGRHGSRDVQQLAGILSEVDAATCSLLRCEGITENTDDAGNLQSFSFLFQLPNVMAAELMNTDLPNQVDIGSLRGFLLKKSAASSLTYRLKVATSLARSIIFLHTASFVHKNIQPENILITVSGEAYLVGFERFRAVESNTYYIGDGHWHKNIYRHPRRQGEAPQDAYTMQHDVYSLGVCLLEIGLFDSFVRFQNDMAMPGSEIEDMPPEKNVAKRAVSMKKKFVDLAREKLPSRMGDRYTDVVVSCLTCLDKDGSFESVDDLEDVEGIQVGVRYIEKDSEPD